MGKKFSKLLAFTLAEVLIVIGIIGVVAEMTIPTVQKSYQEQVTITRLKKITSIISQAILFSQNDGNSLSTPTHNTATDNATMKNFFIPYFKVMKTCESSETSCGLTTFWCLHGNNQGLALPASAYRYILEDGMSIGFYSPSNSFYRVYVDVDGPNKGKNKMGYDIFALLVYLNPIRIYPAYENNPSMLQTDGQGCDDANTLSGLYCYSRVLSDDWQLKYWK